MVNLLKFTSNKNIFGKVVAISYNQFCSQTLSHQKTITNSSIKVLG